MRITGGTLRGRVLPGRVPSGVRPTASRVREALFSILQPSLAGASVLDACGGTGLLSFEAVSRGAAEALVIEKRARTAHAIRASVAHLGIGELVRVQVGQAPRDVPDRTWDLVLVDPPYALDPAPILAGLAHRVAGELVLEHARQVGAPDVPGLRLDRTRRYGDTQLSFYTPSPVQVP